MYRKLGNGKQKLFNNTTTILPNCAGTGWGSSVLALVTLVIGCPSPFIFYKYGPKLRAWSRAASVE